jgi:hypothetical protein
VGFPPPRVGGRAVAGLECGAAGVSELRHRGKKEGN